MRWIATLSIMLFMARTAKAQEVVWRVDNLSQIGGHRVTVIGNPRVVETGGGKAVEFDGIDDGLFLDVNPIAGLARFTIEVEFQPAADGPEEQRFVHFEESGAGNRALIELRMSPGGLWSLDTYLRYGSESLTLLDRNIQHKAGQWYVATLTFDGKTMSHSVNGLRELSGGVAFKPLANGSTSIGVRQNHVSWFKGRIRLIRITRDVP